MYMLFSRCCFSVSVLLDSPVATLGRYFSFWAGLPNSRMPLKPMDWWAPSVMPTPKSWLPTISTSRAYCEPQRHWPIRAQSSLQPPAHAASLVLVCVCTCVLERPRPPRSDGTCNPKAPISFRPSMVWSSTFSRASFLAGSFTSWSKHEQRQRSHWNVKVTRLYPGTKNTFWNYLKEFSNRPNQLAEKLLLLIIHCCKRGQ